MIIAACLDAGIGLLYSEDLPGNDIDGLSIKNPFA
jgi:predicted nucleic acid-binding protein